MAVCNRHKWDHDAECMYCVEQEKMRNSEEFKAMVKKELDRGNEQKK